MSTESGRLRAAEQAILEWRDDQPYSTVFDDVYFSRDNGLLETEYVFIQGNALAARWQSLTTQHFSIMETGFGTGLNFLCACKAWLEHAPADAVLHFTSAEKYPLGINDMHKALKHWPALSPLAEELLAHYEGILRHGSASLFNQRVKLQILFGDAAQCLCAVNSKADAWFLDGFAPSKNPDMWQPALFAQMSRLSHTETTLATFTSAGMVRRGLQAAGFKISKQPGFGKKREMTIGRFYGLYHEP